MTDTAGGVPSLPDGVHASTQELRRMAAAGVSLRLPWQLDFRLDTALEPDGTHILGLFAVLEEDPASGQAFPEPVARCAAMPQFLGLDVGVAFHIALDLRLSDYAACEPMDFDRMDADTVAAWHRFMGELRQHPEVFEHPKGAHTAGHTAVIARTGKSPNR